MEAIIATIDGLMKPVICKGTVMIQPSGDADDDENCDIVQHIQDSLLHCVAFNTMVPEHDEEGGGNHRDGDVGQSHVVVLVAKQ